MGDGSEAVVLAYWNEHRQQFRQSENQRATTTNFVLVVTAGLSGLMIQQKFAATTIPLGVLITVIGLYGALTAAKYHERAAYHLGQARALTATLKDMDALGDDPYLDQFRRKHQHDHPRLHRIRLHWLWTGLHPAIAGYGVVLTMIAVIR